MSYFKQDFLLDPSIHFLNHGSFGACPKPIFEAYQNWQRRLEAQPVLFLGREYHSLLAESRAALGAYLGAHPDNLIYIPNATYGVNIIVRSLDLQPGDEILSTNHEYGACDFTWEFACERTGAVYVRQPLQLPFETEEQLLAQFWAGLTDRTRVVYLSQITSPTALRLPVEAICGRARELGLLTIIDAAHAPGQVSLDLAALDADFVTGNCHKWMLAPKGAAFLYARPQVQSLLAPLVVSWGYGNPPQSANRMLDLFEWSGTKDPAAWLSVPAAIQYMEERDWDSMRRECNALLTQALEQLSMLVRLPPLSPLNGQFYAQMAAAELPAQMDIAWLKTALYDQFRVEVPLIEWQGRKFVRVSIQAYNTPEDVAALLEGLKELLY